MSVHGSQNLERNNCTDPELKEKVERGSGSGFESIGLGASCEKEDSMREKHMVVEDGDVIYNKPVSKRLLSNLTVIFTSGQDKVCKE